MPTLVESDAAGSESSKLGSDDLEQAMAQLNKMLADQSELSRLFASRLSRVDELFRSQLKMVRSETEELKGRLREATGGEVCIASNSAARIASNSSARLDEPRIEQHPPPPPLAANANGPNDHQDTHEAGQVPTGSRRSYFPRNLWSDDPGLRSCTLTDLVVAEELSRQEFKERLKHCFFELQPKSTLMSAGIKLTRGGLTFDPDSSILTAWLVICMLTLVYDLIMLPISTCFSLEQDSFGDAMSFASLIIWSLDMILTFLTAVRINSSGLLERRPLRIACIYFKSWFIFDLILLVPDYISLFLDSNGTESVSLMRAARLKRIVRLMRIGRLLRFSKIKYIVQRTCIALNLSKVYVQLATGWTGLSFMLIVFMHLLSCTWYAIGNSDDANGWVHVNHLHSVSVGHAYIVSMHWNFNRLQGISNFYAARTETEMVLDTCLIFLSIIIVACYTSACTTVFMVKVNYRARALWDGFASFSKTHQISPQLSMRLLKCVESLSFQGPQETAEVHRTLFAAIPESLQHDLLFEARVKSLMTQTFFADELWVSAPAVRRISIFAMQEQIFVENDVVFAHDDVCTFMRFVTDGRFFYVCNSRVQADLDPSVFDVPQLSSRVGFSHNPSTGDGQPVHCTLSSKSAFSEPVLWTDWNHVWRMVAAEESIVLALDAVACATEISQHRNALIHGMKYARHFVRKLNTCEIADDLVTGEDFTIENLDSAEGGDPQSHHIFLSHYKVEAGTEATLMRDQLVDMLAQYPSHSAHNLCSPIFLDSEDLTDLSKLSEHVKMSEFLVLLLTPGLLSRPWCLLEIFTAMRHKVNIVPVEIQRPGSSYAYPDEQFYLDLREGKFLNQVSVDLLAGESITLQDVEKAIRHVFTSISLPFSPHKSKTVREAELEDLLKRCSGESAESLLKIKTGKSVRSGKSSRS